MELLNSSLLKLEPFRIIQAKHLNKRLDVFKNSVLSKYGSYDAINTIKNDNLLPIESKTDVDIIERLIKLKTFITIPIFSDNSEKVKAIYTVGMWYYWGLPEFVVEFDSSVQDITFVNILINIIHDKFFFMYESELLSDDPSNIKRIEYEKQKIDIDLSNFNTKLTLTKIDENDYMSNNVGCMLWFYMYYMDAVFYDGTEPKLNPVYRLKINSEELKSVKENVMSVLIDNISKIDYQSNSDSDSVDSVDFVDSASSDTEQN